MFQFSTLRCLLQHYHNITWALWDKQFFFVWWALRDILLWITDDPKDIDITTAHHPEDLRNHRPQSDNRSCFRTEKFGTITLLPKEEPDTTQENNILQYEITPFREEWWYSDFRHPEEIHRSKSLVNDSKRRDFTINALYWSVINLSSTTLHTKQTEENIDALLLQLTTSGGVYLPEDHILIVQDTTSIESLLDEWEFSIESVKHLIHSLPRMRWAKSRKITYDQLFILLDPQHWIHDIATGTLRTVWDPHQRFGEDALRILRWARFVNILNQKLLAANSQNNITILLFDISNQTWDAMKKNYYLVKHLAKERIYQELIKVFSYNNPFGYISLLDELNLIHLLFPALSSLKQLEQPVRYHPFDVRTHTLLTLYEVQQINTSPRVKFAMLYHDVWKAEQYYFYSLWLSKEEKKLPVSGHMYHTHLGEDLATNDMKNLWFSKKEIQEICWYITKHHRPQELLDWKPENRHKKIRKLISEVGIERVCNLFDIAIADRRWQYNPIQPPTTEEIEELRTIAVALYEQEGRFTMKDLAINWNELMTSFDLSPWPQVWELLETAFNWVIENSEHRNTKKKILHYLKERLPV